MLTDIQTLEQLAQRSGCPSLEMLKVTLDDPVKDVPAHSRGGGPNGL